MEEWRPVPGWPYEVSTEGRIRHAVSRRVRNVKPGRYGRRHLILSKPGSKARFGVHRLVLAAFVGSCPDGMEACHENGDAGDNRLSNLRWDTHAANMKDAERHGTMVREDQRKLTLEQAAEVRERYVPYVVTKAMLAEEFGVSPRLIEAILLERTYGAALIPAKVGALRPNGMTPEREALIRELVKTLPRAEAARRVGVTKSTVTTLLKKEIAA